MSDLPDYTKYISFNVNVPETQAGMAYVAEYDSTPEDIVDGHKAPLLVDIKGRLYVVQYEKDRSVETLTGKFVRVKGHLTDAVPVSLAAGDFGGSPLAEYFRYNFTRVDVLYDQYETGPKAYTDVATYTVPTGKVGLVIWGSLCGGLNHLVWCLVRSPCNNLFTLKKAAGSYDNANYVGAPMHPVAAGESIVISRQIWGATTDWNTFRATVLVSPSSPKRVTYSQVGLGKLMPLTKALPLFGEGIYPSPYSIALPAYAISNVDEARKLAFVNIPRGLYRADIPTDESVQEAYPEWIDGWEAVHGKRWNAHLAGIV